MFAAQNIARASLSIMLNRRNTSQPTTVKDLTYLQNASCCIFSYQSNKTVVKLFFVKNRDVVLNIILKMLLTWSEHDYSSHQEIGGKYGLVIIFIEQKKKRKKKKYVYTHMYTHTHTI